MSATRIFQTTPKIVIGAGCLNQVSNEITKNNCKKVMIVTDPGIVAVGIAGKLEQELTLSKIIFSRYDKIEPDPSTETALNAIEAIKDFGADLVIGLGGGSAIDIAKVAAVMSINEGTLSDYVGINLIPKPGLKTIAIPTTAGTGSEVTPIAILSDEKEKLKKGVVSPYLLPQVAFLDPELTTGLPPDITASTGMDALIHAVEAYTSNNAYPMTDMLSREAIRLINTNIRTAFANGINLEARSDMLEGSMLAGMSFANAGVTAVHAFAYPIGSQFHIPHGIANSIMLVPVMEFNIMGNIKKFGELATLLGANTKGLNKREMAMASVQCMRTLSNDLQIPTRLGQFGVKDSDIPMIAKGVMKVTRLLANNPRIMTYKDAERIYRSVL